MSALQKIENELAPLAVTTPMQMLQIAVERGADIDMIEKLMTLQERWEANQARKAFDNAMAAAKAEIPVIAKNRTVNYEGRGGSVTTYRHEDMAEIARTVDPILTKHGLSYRFRATSEPAEPVKVTCIVSHRDGHSETTTLSAGRDESGSKNSIQGVGSAITYLQRYTLKAALGLAASADDDGGLADQSGPISPAQLEELIALADDVGADEERFCKFMKVAGLAEIPASQFDAAKAKLQAKRVRS